MSTPIRSATGPRSRGPVAAWAFDQRSGNLAADASDAGNAGTLIGATWTNGGRFGHALRFDGAGAVVRVPASSSLDLRAAMTLAAWIRPADSQAGWRTVVQRQTDAYFLMAGGGEVPTASADPRFALVLGAAACLCVALVAAGTRWLDASPSWWPPIALFLAGSAIDVWLTGRGTVIGPTLVAIWYAVSARRRVVAMSMFAVAVGANRSDDPGSRRPLRRRPRPRRRRRRPLGRARAGADHRRGARRSPPPEPGRGARLK